MGLVRAWRRQLCEASGAALVVPGSIAGALAVLAIAGGFGGLTGIGQALSGPSVPAASSSPGASLSAAARTLKVADARTSSAAPFAHRPVVAGIGTSAGIAPAAPHGGAPTITQGHNGFTGNGSGGTTGTGVGNGSGSGGQPTTAPQQPPASVVQSAAGAVTGIANQVARPVLSATGEALGSVSSTLQKALPGSR